MLSPGIILKWLDRLLWAGLNLDWTAKRGKFKHVKKNLHHFLFSLFLLVASWRRLFFIVPALNRLSQTEPMIEGVAFFFKGKWTVSTASWTWIFFLKGEAFLCPHLPSSLISYCNLINYSEKWDEFSYRHTNKEAGLCRWKYLPIKPIKPWRAGSTKVCTRFTGLAICTKLLTHGF